MADHPTHLPETLDPAAGAAGSGGDTVPDLSLTLLPPRHRAISDGVGGVGFDSAGSNLSLSPRTPLRDETDETDSDHLKLTLELPNRAIPEVAVEAPDRPVQDIGESEAEYRLRINDWFLYIGNETRSSWSTYRLMLEEAYDSNALADMDDLQVDSEDMDDPDYEELKEELAGIGASSGET